MMKILIVAGEEDSFATSFAHFASCRGRPCSILDVHQAAREFTIVVGEKHEVEPRCSLLLRLSFSHEQLRGKIRKAEFDEEFLQEEAEAHVWSAAALTRANVINRPTYLSFCGRFSDSNMVRDQRSDICSLAEIFHSYPLESEVLGDSNWWMQCESSGQKYCIDRHYRNDARGPFRTRIGSRNFAHYAQCIVGERVFSLTNNVDISLNLEDKALAVAKRLRLDFAIVLWIDSKETGLRLAAVSPSPGMAELGKHSTEIFSALLEIL